MTMTYTGTLTLVSCWCGVHLAIPETLYREAFQNGTAVYCPLGHTFVWKESQVDRLTRELATAESQRKAARAALVATRDQRDAAERSNRAYRGWITRLRNKIAAGVCPVAGCHRHFENVQAHIATQHPEWRELHAEALVAAGT